MLLENFSELKIARRDLLLKTVKGGGALVLSFGLSGKALLAAGHADNIPQARNLDPKRLDTWLAINREGEVTVYWGKMDMGQGVDTAVCQMVAEELDVAVDRVNAEFGDTYLSADQGGASGSSGCSSSGTTLREAAAEARMVLLELASARLNVPASDLTVTDGMIHARSNPSIAVSYGELIGDKLFNVMLEWNGEYGNDLELKSRAGIKDPSDYKVVGTPVRRKDIAGKIIPKTEFAVHVRVPGMLHGRMVRPPSAGAKLISADRSSVSNIPGVQVVVEKDFVGVVAPKEWDAVRAARELKVSWDETDSGFPTTSEDLYRYIREAKAGTSEVTENKGDVETALSGSTKVIEAEYEWPFQSHARMGPSFGLADVNSDQPTVWTDSQKYADTALCAAKFLGLNTDGDRLPVRAIWHPGPGSYGRSDAGDGAMDAVILSRAVGAPVRVQWMRSEGHAWDPKGPAAVIRIRGGLDAAGKVIAFENHVRGFSKQDVRSREESPGETLAGQALGYSRQTRWDVPSGPQNSYDFINERHSLDGIPPLREQVSPLRCSHFRDPSGPHIHFASESFIDELAYATGRDPVEFRLAYLTDPRDKAVIEAAAELAAWVARPSPNPGRGNGNILIGRGIAYAQRNGATNAVIAEIEVNRQTGRVWVRRFFVGSDHGLIINPFTLDRTIEGNLIQAASRTLFEEVRFDRKMVRSNDWISYPILGSLDAPLEVKINKINRPELGPRGAGEPVTRVVPGAIANAFFDATGVRLRTVPFSPERVKAALNSV